MIFRELLHIIFYKSSLIKIYPLKGKLEFRYKPNPHTIIQKQLCFFHPQMHQK